MASGTIKIPAGLELAYDLEKANIQNGLDAFVLSLHWSVIRTGLLQRATAQSTELTERLPSGWTQRSPNEGSARTLSLFYYDRHNPRIKYELKVIELTPNDMVAVTFFRSPIDGAAAGTGSSAQDQSAASSQSPAATATANRPASTAGSGTEKNSAAATFQIGNFVKLSAFEAGKQRDKATDAFEHADRLETQFYESIMEPLGLRVMGQPPVQGPYEDHTKAAPPPTHTQERREQRDPLADDRFPDMGRRPSPFGPGMPLGPLHVPPLMGGGGLGRSDLDPLGRFGAGNILDPRGFRTPRIGGGMLPGLPGGIPNGARFDPFGPPNPNRPDGGAGAFNLPNPDHERPPPGSDYDDMFM